MTNSAMQSLKEYFSDSVFIIGKNHVMKVALNKEPKDEIKANSSKLCSYLKGLCGLLFSNHEPDEIIKYFKEYSCPYYGNVGTISKETLILKRGFDPHLADFPSSMESQFRHLGLNLKLVNEKFALIEDYKVCEEGKPLNADQSKMCKHLNIYQDEFKINIRAYLGMNGEFKEVNEENI